MEPGVAFFAADGPTDPLADDADADPADEDGEETFKTAAYFAELMVHRRLEDLEGVQHWVRCEGRDSGHQIDQISVLVASTGGASAAVCTAVNGAAPLPPRSLSSLQWPQCRPYIFVPVVARAFTMPLVTRHPRVVRP